MSELAEKLLSLLRDGAVIPAHPLALTVDRRLDERRQAALTRYYCDAGAGGIAVGVHTTQFGIHSAKIGLLAPVLELASVTSDEALRTRSRPLIKIAGIVGGTRQAIKEAELARSFGYHAGLLSLAALNDESDDALLDHCRHVAEHIPLFGFYLQPAVGGRELTYSFWRRFAEIPNLIAIKIAPFDRYRTLDVVRAVADSDRDDIALYTGNDDNIVADLLTEFPIGAADRRLRITGGLLGHWAVWTHRAVQFLAQIRQERDEQRLDHRRWLAYGTQVTDANSALFDSANAFKGCIAGIHEVLRRQGLMLGNWCLDADECLSLGQMEEIDRVYRSYPHLNDDQFVAEHLDRWLA